MGLFFKMVILAAEKLYEPAFRAVIMSSIVTELNLE